MATTAMDDEKAPSLKEKDQGQVKLVPPDTQSESRESKSDQEDEVPRERRKSGGLGLLHAITYLFGSVS